MNKIMKPDLNLFFMISIIVIMFIIFTSSCSDDDSNGKKQPVDIISGRVLCDGSGVSGLSVSLSEWDGTVAVQDTLTDEKGKYTLIDVDPGYYRITVDLSGDYEKSVSRNINKVDSIALKDINFIINTDTLRQIGDNINVVGTIEDNGVHAWIGIPYAKPPTGDLRWRSPVEADPWTKTYPAIAKCEVCPQYAGLLSDVPEHLHDKPIGSEDCLYLNIWAPAFDSVPDAGDLLPVMVWIHGGGNSIGEGGMYNGKYLAESYEVIFISINYRLGPLGWFSHPALSNEEDTELDRSGNFGTLDIIKALEWVRDNITSFGGDTSNVTVFGESAGGANTLTMMASDRSDGLFHRAVVQSGALNWSTVEEAEEYTEDGGHTGSSREIINRLLIINEDTVENRDQAKAFQDGMTDEQIDEYLRSISAYGILEAYDGGYGGMISMPGLFRDGTVLPDADPLSLFVDGSYNKVPCILGTNRDEYKLFMFLNPEYVDVVLGFIPHVKDRAYYELSAKYFSDFWKVYGVDEIAAAMHINQPGEVFAYRFDWDEQPVIFGIDLSFMLGAAHGLEIPFVMNSSDDFIVPSMKDYVYTEENRPGREFLAATMSSYWVQFALSGDPGSGYAGSQTQEWRAWASGEDGDKMIIFNTEESGGVRMSDMTITRDSLRTELQDEDGFTTDEQKCKVYLSIFGEDDYYSETCIE